MTTWAIVTGQPAFAARYAAVTAAERIAPPDS